MLGGHLTEMVQTFRGNGNDGQLQPMDILWMLQGKLTKQLGSEVTPLNQEQGQMVGTLLFPTLTVSK